MLGGHPVYGGVFHASRRVMFDRAELVDDALNQWYWHIQYLQNERTGLWYHGYDNMAGNHMSGFYWGRANCWAAFTMSQVAHILPQCYLYPNTWRL